MEKLGSSLHDKLTTVERLLGAGKARQAEDGMGSFLAQVSAQRDKGLTDAQADVLDDAGQQIVEVIEA